MSFDELQTGVERVSLREMSFRDETRVNEREREREARCEKKE